MGMGPLTHACRKRIVQFTLNSIAAIEESMSERAVGEMVLVSEGAGKTRKKRAMALAWSGQEVAVVYEPDMASKPNPGTSASVRVFRTPPPISNDELEQAAVELGCTREPPYRKQLRFEMRKATALLLKQKKIEKDPRERTIDLYRVVR